MIRVSLSEPHIDHVNGPRVRNNCWYVCMYICIIDLHLLHTCSWDPCMPWNTPFYRYYYYNGVFHGIHVHVYRCGSCVWLPTQNTWTAFVRITCVIYNYMHSSTEQQGRMESEYTRCLLWRLLTKAGTCRWMLADTWYIYKWIQHLHLY